MWPRHFVLGAVVTSGDGADTILARDRKILRYRGKDIPEFHESLLNKMNPETIHVLIDNMVFEHHHRHQHRNLRHEVTVWVA